MNEPQFWSILAACQLTQQTSDHDWFEALAAELMKLPPEEIVLFRRILDDKIGAAYKTDLWGAAYLINGGSDDGFHYFRWLVGMGQQVYEQALANPDSLADVLNGEETGEPALDSAPRRAWTEKTGRTEEEFYQVLDAAENDAEDAEEGEEWDFDDDCEMRRRFPRLAALYLDE